MAKALLYPTQLNMVIIHLFCRDIFTPKPTLLQKNHKICILNFKGQLIFTILQNK